MTLLTILCLLSNDDELSFHTEIPALLHDQSSAVPASYYDVSSRVAVDMDIHGYIHGYIHVWISDFGNIYGYLWILMDIFM